MCVFLNQALINKTFPCYRGKKVLSTFVGLAAVGGAILGFIIALGIGYQRWATVGMLTHDSYEYDNHITYDILKNIKIRNLR